MRPINLKMSAFGPYVAPLELDFEKGLNGKNFFLICGATGAGKTSILDAICFALYGKSSGEDRQAYMLHSDKANFDTECEVEFSFALGEKIYKVRRTITQKLEKGKATFSQNVEFYVDGEFKTKAVQETNNLIKDLTGFDAKQFCQVVMLPQGKFQNFLKAKTDERKDILNVIFNAGEYGLVEENLKKKFETAEQEKKNLESQRENYIAKIEMAGNFNAENLDEEKFAESVKNISAEVDDLNNNCAELEKRLKKAGEDLTAGKILKEQFEQFEKASQTLQDEKKSLEKISADF